MPFRSVAQQHFLEAHPNKVGGPKRLKEWEKSTNFSSIPRRKFSHATGRKEIK